jgi:hypothetical protein
MEKEMSEQAKSKLVEDIITSPELREVKRDRDFWVKQVNILRKQLVLAIDFAKSCADDKNPFELQRNWAKRVLLENERLENER